MANIRLDWRWVLARGILGILFGILVLMNPIAGLLTAALLFAAYVAVDGLMALSSAWRMNQAHERGRGFLIAQGVLGVVAGLVAAFFPGLALITLIALMSVWALTSGFVAVYAAVAYRDRITSPVLLGIVGAAAVIFGLFVIMRPVAGAVALLATLAAYALFSGVFLTFWSFRLRQFQHGQRPHMPTRHREAHVL